MTPLGDAGAFLGLGLEDFMKGVEEEGGAGGPSEGAEPVGEDEALDEAGRGGFGEGGMKRDLEQAGAEPEQQNESGRGDGLDLGDEGGAKRWEECGESGDELDEHGWEDDVAGAVSVANGVGAEAGWGGVGEDVVEERVVDDLDEPDEAGHEEGGGELGEEEGFGHLGGADGTVRRSYCRTKLPL